LKPRIEIIKRLRCGKCNCYLGTNPPPKCTRCSEPIDDNEFSQPQPQFTKFSSVKLQNLNDPYDNY